MKKSPGRKERRRLIRNNRKSHGKEIINADKKAKERKLWKKKRAKAKLARKQRKAA